MSTAPPPPPDITAEVEREQSRNRSLAQRGKGPTGPNAWRSPRSEHMEGRVVSPSTYSAGCRCEGCTEANRKYKYQLKLRKAAEAGEPGYPEPDPEFVPKPKFYGEHVEGQPVSRSTYINHQCRCEGCTVENIKYAQAYYEQRKKKS